MEDEELQQEIANNEPFLQYIREDASLMEMIQQNPEMLKQLYQDYTGQQNILDEKILQADALRTNAPEGTHAGNVYVAPNPMEHIAHMGNEAIAAYQKRKAVEKMEEFSSDKSKGLQSVIQNMNNEGEEALDPRAKELRMLEQLQQNAIKNQNTEYEM